MELRDIKFRFFTLRNGLLADMLRKQMVSTHKLIFGLNLPQIKEIAKDADPKFAHELWAEKDCRESRLLAPMLMEPTAEALEMLKEMQTPEEADVACHSLLRRCPGATEAAMEAAGSDEPMTRYAGLRLLMNLMPGAAQTAACIVENIPFHPMTDGVVRQLRQELEYVDDL